MSLPPPYADLERRLASRLAETLNNYRRSIAERLEGESRRLVAAVADLHPTSLGTLLQEADLEALTETPRREAAEDALAGLLVALRSIDRATGQAGALDALLDAAASAGDRALLLLLDEDGVEPWGARAVGRVSLGTRVDWDDALRADLAAADGCRAIAAGRAATLLERFGAAGGGEAVLVPLVLRDRIAALLWVDREGDAPELAVLQILVHAAANRLELQALSERAASPTLYGPGEHADAGLPLWSTTVAAAVAEPEIEPEPEVVPDAESDATAEPESAIETEASTLDVPVVAPEAEVDEVAPEMATEATPEVEFEAEPIEEPPPFDEAPAFEEPQPEDEMEAAVEIDESVPVEEYFEVAPETAEPEPPAVDAVAETAEAPVWTGEPEPPIEAPEEPAEPVDPHGTVRLPIPPADAAPPPLAEPPAADASVESPAEELPSTTAPFPTMPEPATAPEPPVEETDFSEDATVLSMQRPPLPEPPPAPETPPPPPPAEDPMDRTASRMRTTQVAPPPDIEGPGRAFLGGAAPRTTAMDPQHEEAKRLARLLISEIKLYNEEQVIEGRRQRDLYHRLKDDIDRSRQIYDERVGADVRTEVDYFQQELIRSLAGGDPRSLGI